MNTLKLLYWKLQASCLHEETLLNYCKRLEKDTRFLTNEGTLSEKLVDRIVLHLYRIYPQILNNTEAEMFRNVNTPVCVRISELLLHLQKKSNRACKEFYNALETNDAQIYKKLPSKYLARTITSMGINMDTYNREKYILNDRGPVFFLACFSVAAGLAFLLYYCKEDIKVESAAKKIIGFSSLGVGRRARRCQEQVAIGILLYQCTTRAFFHSLGADPNPGGESPAVGNCNGLDGSNYHNMNVGDWVSCSFNTQFRCSYLLSIFKIYLGLI
ncbi:caspase recruitment domain family, member 19 isoform X2 [Hemiscyllium ocellatum]|nr:caspase recruitment domain family, member 19 isoform X2 [Hemiscyllium ocellatum]